MSDPESTKVRTSRSSQSPKSVACIIVTSGERPELAPLARHARGPPSFRPLAIPQSTLPLASLVGARHPTCRLSCLLTPVQLLLAFPGFSREHRPSSTEADEFRRGTGGGGQPASRGGIRRECSRARCLLARRQRSQSGRPAEMTAYSRTGRNAMPSEYAGRQLTVSRFRPDQDRMPEEPASQHAPAQQLGRALGVADYGCRPQNARSSTSASTL
jgi:hypothetical protein